MVLEVNEKKVVKENKLISFYLNFSKNKKIIETIVYARETVI